MDKSKTSGLTRDDVRRRAQQDFARRRRRAPRGRFWEAVALVGSVGWPIVLLATGGALLGRLLEARWSTQVHLTLTLLVLGAALGTWIAFRTVRARA
ncbi:MAG: AtpZ/AtpI family protein [Nannocystaceae bacterium]|nr:AtpZ/AtpI family protein [Myxococcales bacterium]